MSETWKAPWKCEKCGRVIASKEEVRDDCHLIAPGGVFCDGKWLPYDRRAPVEPGTQESAPGLRKVLEDVKYGEMSWDDAFDEIEKLAALPTPPAVEPAAEGLKGRERAAYIRGREVSFAQGNQGLMYDYMVKVTMEANTLYPDAPREEKA